MVQNVIEAGVTTNFEWAGILPVMDVFLIPWLVTDLNVIEKALDGEPGAILFKALESKGVVPLMWLLQCRTNLYTSNEAPLILPKDFKGKKMRGTSKIMNLGSEGPRRFDHACQRPGSLHGPAARNARYRTDRNRYGLCETLLRNPEIRNGRQ